MVYVVPWAFLMDGSTGRLYIPTSHIVSGMSKPRGTAQIPVVKAGGELHANFGVPYASHVNIFVDPKMFSLEKGRMLEVKIMAPDEATC